MLTRLIKDFIKTGYECLGAAVLLAFFFMFFYMCVREYGLKATIKRWQQQFMVYTSFRRAFFLALYTFFVLTKTVLGRSIWHDPYGKIFQDWQIIDGNGHIALALVENMVLFMPFTFLVLWNMEGLLAKKNRIKRSFAAIVIGFLFSLGIELIQLLTRLGTFQFSDIFYNTVGGVIGVLCYEGLSCLWKWVRKT